MLNLGRRKDLDPSHFKTSLKRHDKQGFQWFQSNLRNHWGYIFWAIIKQADKITNLSHVNLPQSNFTSAYLLLPIDSKHFYWLKLDLSIKYFHETHIVLQQINDLSTKSVKKKNLRKHLNMMLLVITKFHCNPLNFGSGRTHNPSDTDQINCKMNPTHIPPLHNLERII